jgi:thioredoxin 1
MAVQITSDNFEQEVLKSDTPVLIDFWAPWCGPCKMVAPVVEEIANEQKDKLKVGKVNVDEAQDIAGRYGIMSIPTLLYFDGGEVKQQLVGAMPKDEILRRIGLAG